MGDCVNFAVAIRSNTLDWSIKCIGPYFSASYVLEEGSDAMQTMHTNGSDRTRSPLSRQIVTTAPLRNPQMIVFGNAECHSSAVTGETFTTFAIISQESVENMSRSPSSPPLARYLPLCENWRVLMESVCLERVAVGLNFPGGMGGTMKDKITRG